MLSAKDLVTIIFPLDGRGSDFLNSEAHAQFKKMTTPEHPGACAGPRQKAATGATFVLL